MASSPRARSEKAIDSTGTDRLLHCILIQLQIRLYAAFRGVNGKKNKQYCCLSFTYLCVSHRGQKWMAIFVYSSNFSK